MGALYFHLDAGSSLSTPPTIDEFLRHERDPTVAALCLMLDDRGEAEALARDAFATVWERWDRVGSPDPVGYLRRVAMRSFRRRIRRIRWRTIARNVARRIAPGRTHPHPGTEATAGDGLGRLTPLHRAALVLTELWRYDHSQAGRALGVPASTIGKLTREGRAALMDGEPTHDGVRPVLERELAAAGPARLDVSALERVRRHRRRRETIASLGVALALVAVVATATRSPSESARVPVAAIHRSASVDLERILLPGSATPLGTRFLSRQHGVSAVLADVPAATGLARRGSIMRFIGPAAPPLRRTSLETWAVEFDSPVAAQTAMSALALSLHFDWGLVDSLPAGLPRADQGVRFVDRSIPRNVVYLWRHEHVLLRLVAGGSLRPSDVRPVALAMDDRAVAAIR
ncbi:MAG TPA: hypothetical protein VIC52_08525 [Actinomycetota bacterium]